VLLASLIFILATVLSIALHVRAGHRAPSGDPTCPRCRAVILAGARTCAECGLPFQAVELTRAPEAPADAAQSANAPLRALVRSDQCVGCGACVAACPEEGALAMRGTLAVVDPAKCVGHGECANACPVGAITMTRGGAENRVRVPWVDAGFQSSVPGLYIVGELGGRDVGRQPRAVADTRHRGRARPVLVRRADGHARNGWLGPGHAELRESQLALLTECSATKSGSPFSQRARSRSAIAREP
jgi:Pyruvate/2-oxoacid:ferredoxin oxidoreductase delta subunit